MVKETKIEETIGFDAIIFIVGGISTTGRGTGSQAPLITPMITKVGVNANLIPLP